MSRFWLLYVRPLSETWKKSKVVCTWRSWLTWRHRDEFSASVEGDRLAVVDPLLVVVIQQAAELDRESLGRNVKQKLRKGNREDSISKFLSDEKSEDFEGSFEPERSGDD